MSSLLTTIIILNLVTPQYLTLRWAFKCHKSNRPFQKLLKLQLTCSYPPLSQHPHSQSLDKSSNHPLVVRSALPIWPNHILNHRIPARLKGPTASLAKAKKMLDQLHKITTFSPVARQSNRPSRSLYLTFLRFAHPKHQENQENHRTSYNARKNVANSHVIAKPHLLFWTPPELHRVARVIQARWKH